MRDALAFLRVHRRLIAVVVALCTVVAVFYAFLTTPLYTSESRILVDATRGQLTRSREDAGGGNLAVELAEVETQLQIIRSQKIALMVVDALDLTKDPEFAGRTGGGGWSASITDLLQTVGLVDAPLRPQSVHLDARHRAADVLMGQLKVARIGASYVVSVAFTSTDPEKAAAVTNTLTTSYITERLDAKFEVAQRMNNTEDERARELRTRVISVATPSPDPSHPRRKVIVGLAMVFGLTAGIALALLRQSLDQTLRTPSDVTRLGLAHLATLPNIGFAGPGLWATVERVLHRRKKSPLPGLHYVRDHPLSLYAQSLRRAKGAIQVAKRGDKGMRIGIVSSLMSEGKSTVASNLATLLDADAGRAVLIDADLRGKALTRAYRAAPPKNQTLAFLDVNRLRAALEKPQVDGPVVSSLPEVPHGGGDPAKPAPEPPSEDVLASPRMAALLDNLANTFDYVVVDLPPSALVPDALILARHLDEIVVVAEWGQTSPDMLGSVVSALGDNQSKVLGVVINKANIARLQDEGHGALGLTYPHMP